MDESQLIVARDVTLCAVNDAEFSEMYATRARKLLTPRASQRRTLIGRFMTENHLDPTGLANTATAREQIRRHLDDYWSLPKAIHSTENGAHDLSHILTIDLFDDGRVTANDVKKPEPQPAPQEPTMNANPIEISTKTFVNGQDIANMSDAAIYDLIASEEAKIKELQKIENKPKKLLAEVNRRSTGIVDLVAYLDSKAD